MVNVSGSALRKKERIQKIIARAGVTSRRKAESLILSGRVRVNGSLVKELGARVDPHRDHIKVDGKLIHIQRLEYYVLNKPRKVLSSVMDEKGRRVVIDFLNPKIRDPESTEANLGIDCSTEP